MLHMSIWKKLFILLICVIGTLFALPTFMGEETRSRLPSWLNQSVVNLGLDLQGGSHLLLEVDVDSVIKERLESLGEETRRALRQEGVRFTGLKIEKERLSFDLQDGADEPKARRAFKESLQEVTTSYEAATNKFTRSFTDQATAQIRKQILSQSQEIVIRRINELGTREPNIQSQGISHIIVQLPGVKDPSQIKKLLGKTAKLTFRLVDAEAPTLSASGGRILPGTDALPLDEKQEERKGGEKVVYLVKKQVLLTGESLEDAQVGFDDKNNKIKVNIRFDTRGARKFGEITTNNTGKQLAIILDDKVISAPVLNEPILGGRAEISGGANGFTLEEASNLALLMRAGSLPAPLHVIEERTVGPDLGADSIAAGQKATYISVAFIAVFMVILYMLFGVFANLALIFNVLFLIAALALTGSTLTLPGIAGIALTLGMAVDANVLIYERIKEELRLGRRILQAVDAGYGRAMSTIVDSNITTLICAAALYFFGVGPIRGFGVTLAMGILISMFTAITLTRLLAIIYINWAKPKELSI